jgi:hypothetical protein
LAALAQIPDHRLLIAAAGGMGGQGLTHGRMGGNGGVLAGSAGGALNQPLLDGQQVRGGPTALLQGPVGDHADRPLSQEPIRQLLQHGPSGAGQPGAEGDQDLRAGEGGRVLGQPLRAGQPVEESINSFSGHRPVLDPVGCPASHRPDQSVRVHATFSRLLPPAAVQGVRSLVLLGLASCLDSPLDQPRCPLPPILDQPVELGVDLAGALGELPNQVLGQALELPVTVAVCRRPLHPKRPDERPLVGGPVDSVRGQPMAVDIAAVQRCPASVRPLDPVGHHQMGVQQRVTLPGCPVVEADRQHPLSGHVLDTAMAAAGPQVSVQVADRLGQPGMMGGQHGSAGRRVTQAVQDRHALGRPHDHVEGGHGVCAVGAAEELASGGVAAFEHGLEPGRRCFALQPEAGGAGTVPRPGDSPWPDRYCSWSVASSRV